MKLPRIENDKKLGEMRHLVCIEPLVLLRWMPYVIVALVLLDLFGLWSTYVWGHGRLLGLVPMFRLDFEKNIPTAVSAGLLLFCAFLTALQASTSRMEASADRKYWVGMALAFTFVGLDEWFVWHEQLIRPVREALGLSGYLYYAWIIPYSIITLILAGLYLKFFLQLPRMFRTRLIISAAFFFSGAVGMEMIGGAYIDGDEAARGIVGLITTLEETLELVGAFLAVRAFVFGFGFYEFNLSALQHSVDNIATVVEVQPGTRTRV
jgi:hypothetical protein